MNPAFDIADILDIEQSGRRIPIVLGAKGIDFKTPQEVVLLTTRDGYLVPTRDAFFFQLVTNQTVAPEYSIGTNAPDYDNIRPRGSATASPAVSGRYKRGNIDEGYVIPPNTSIVIKIHVGATADVCVAAIGLEVVKI